MTVNKRWLLHIIAALAGVGVVVLLLAHAGFDRFLYHLRRGKPEWIAAAFAVYALAWVFRTVRLQKLTGRSGVSIPAWVLFRLHVAGYALNAVLPAKMGDVATMGFLKLRGIPFPRAAAVVFQTRILDLISLVALTLPGLLLGFPKLATRWTFVSIALGLMVVAAVLFLVMLDRRGWVTSIIERGENRVKRAWIGFLLAKARDFYRGYREIVTDRRLFGLSLVVSLAVWVVEGCTAFTITRAIGADLPLEVVFFAVAMANLGKSAPVTPGGIGIYESMFAAALVLAGIGFDLAITIAILDHAVKKIFNLSVGLPSAAMMGLNFRQIYDMSQRKFSSEGGGDDRE